MAQNAQGGGSAATNFGIVAWLTYGVLSGASHWIAAASLALLVACAIVAHEYKSSAIKIMSCTTASFFAFALVVTAILGPAFCKNYNVFITWGTFAAVAWATLLIGFPFTIQYAREQSPREVWDQPLFMHLNVILTLVFGIVFTVNTGLGFIAFRTGRLLTIGLIVPMSLFITALIFSSIYPKHFINKLTTEISRERKLKVG